jgi:simple sugar transport system ATP-binding protein
MPKGERRRAVEKFLEMKNISKLYAGVRALDNVSFSLDYGEIHCLVGENGSGKSTLIKIISGVIPPEEGAEIKIEGRPLDISHFTSKDSIHNGVHVIYQDLSLFPNLTVRENISFNVHVEKGRKLVNWSGINNIAQNVINDIGIDIDLDRVLGTMSIADQQLVAICKALIGELKLLIMDEPTSSLTKNEVDSLFSVVKKLKKRGITTLFVSHKLNEILEIAERVTVLRDGECVGIYNPDDLSHEKLTFLMTGKKIEYTRPDESHVKHTVLLQVRRLTKKGNFKNVDLDLHEGEILGITGLLGSGRTELALALFGINPSDRGEIVVKEKKVTIRSNKDAIRNGIGYVPEDRLELGLIMPQSVGNNITVTILDNLLNSIKMIDKEKRRQAVEKGIADLAIRIPSVDSAVMTLSGGNQQRVVLAKWISTNPKILILDEPTVGIDVAAKSSIHDIIKKLAARGIGIIIISDEIQEVLYNCHRVLVMRRGRLVSEVKTRETTEEQLFDLVNAG